MISGTYLDWILLPSLYLIAFFDEFINETASSSFIELLIKLKPILTNLKSELTSTFVIVTNPILLTDKFFKKISAKIVLISSDNLSDLLYGLDGKIIIFSLFLLSHEP